MKTWKCTKGHLTERHHKPDVCRECKLVRSDLWLSSFKEVNNMKTNKQLTEIITAKPARSAWARGVKAYALELIEGALVDPLPTDREALKKELLNGADNWTQYSQGGCALIYDADICERLCSPSEIKKTRNGERQPDTRETWLDCQARALGQAFSQVFRAINSAN